MSHPFNKISPTITNIFDDENPPIPYIMVLKFIKYLIVGLR